LEFSPGFNITIYASPDDKALETAGWLFGSIARLGRIDAAMFAPHQIDEFRTFGAVDVIQVRGTPVPFGHRYFISHPAVSADIIPLVRSGRRPNEPGRPLEEVVRPFWRVPTKEKTNVGNAAF